MKRIFFKEVEENIQKNSKKSFHTHSQRAVIFYETVKNMQTKNH